ncbi:hypothetical protein JCM24511_09068 [Saitozyma sp. JCM 24511]|nr:hypothetical protein JCM24511_09068 [Saitozyma sp. JCM 24511]
MSDATSVPSERGVWFFTEALTLSENDGDLIFSTGEGNGNGQVVSGDAGEGDRGRLHQGIHAVPWGYLPELGAGSIDGLGRQIRYMEMTVTDPDHAPWANQTQYLKHVDGVLLTEPRPGARSVDGSWWAFHGGVHIEDDPGGNSCAITFGHETQFRLCTGSKDKDRWLEDVNDSLSNFPVLDHVHHWVMEGENPPDKPDQDILIEFRLSSDRTVRCSHSANHWRSLDWKDKADDDIRFESVWFAADRDSTADVKSGANDGSASGDHGQGSVKGTAVYLVGPYTEFIKASRRPDPTSV